MVRDIAEGYIIATELTFKKFQMEDFNAVRLRGRQAPPGISGHGRAGGRRRGTQKRQRRMQRLQQAMTIANAARAKQR